MSDLRPPTAEDQRLADARERGVPWRRWGPYVSERQWGTVREDYSADGDAWNCLTHEQARSRAYRWGEDGIAGISDEQQRLCFALTLWNGADPILKERLFGLTGPEGNHGEDVKECYFYLDNLPSHAYMKYLYKYPQCAYPYEQLLQENRRRGRHEPEYELLDTGIFDDDRYFDVFVEYAKDGPDDMLVRISAINRGAQPAPLHLLPTLWCRNDWSWTPGHSRPLIRADPQHPTRLQVTHPALEPYCMDFDAPLELLFTENESNRARLWGESAAGFAKDAFIFASFKWNKDNGRAAYLVTQFPKFLRDDCGLVSPDPTARFVLYSFRHTFIRATRAARPVIHDSEIKRLIGHKQNITGHYGGQDLKLLRSCINRLKLV